MHCDHVVQFSADFTLWLYSQWSGPPDNKACPPTPNRLFPVLRGTEVGYGCAM